jgi:hypothetical protein
VELRLIEVLETHAWYRGMLVEGGSGVVFGDEEGTSLYESLLEH